MSQASSSLFYGVFVKPHRVILAAESFALAESSLKAVDLICIRRRKGNLSTEQDQSSVVTRIPDEIWQAIKREIIESTFIQAELELFNQYGDFYFPYNSDDEMTWDGLVKSDGFSEGFAEDGEGWERWLSAYKSKIHALGAYFGFSVSLKHLLSGNPEYHLDIDSLCAIGLPRAFASSEAASTSDFPPTVNLHAYGGDGCPKEQEVVQFSHSAMRIPPSTDQRFEQFLSLFRLDPQNPKARVVRPTHEIKESSPIGTKGDAQKKNMTTEKAKKKKPEQEEEGYHEKACCSDGKSRPHWHLWTTSRADDDGW